MKSVNFPTEGIMAVYKPVGMTSHDAIDVIRKKTGVRKVGHAGTLDPLASGVLVVGIGRQATKRLSAEVAKEKEYVAEVRLGMTSTTDDEEGEKTTFPRPHFELPSETKVKEVIKRFIGERDQVPPTYSAIKVSGQEAYKRVRRGEKVIMKRRKVTIYSIEVLRYDYPLLRLKVVTGPGVYIRALARDIGQELGVGGYLSGLERTRVGEYGVAGAIGLE